MTQAWYPFYWSDYSGKTLHLTQGQHGAYMLFLRYVYTTGKPIPDEHRYSIARAMLEQEQGNADFVLHSFFERADGFWRSKRAEAIIRETEEKHAKRVSAGKKGGKARSSNARAKPKRKASNAQVTTTTTTTTCKSSGAKAPSPPPTPSLPDWLPAQDWQDYLAMRNQGGKVMTPRARQLALKELERLRGEGHPPDLVLQQSILRSWSGVFPLKRDGPPRREQPKITATTI